jgi:glutaredoxin-dependent peroxiredoxin
MAIALGTKAPDFTLKTKRGEDLKDIKLSDNFGKKKTVLLFFPLAFTGVCTKELCEVSGGLAAYEKLDATVYALSVDSPFAQEAWADKEKISLTLLSDLNKEVSKAYGTLLPDLIGLGSALVPPSSSIKRESSATPSKPPPLLNCPISKKSKLP